MMQTGRKAEQEPIDAKQEYAHRRTSGPSIVDPNRYAGNLENASDRRLSFSSEADVERWETGQPNDAFDAEHSWARATRDRAS